MVYLRRKNSEPPMSAWGHLRPRPAVRGQALSDYPPLQCRCRSRARASLRNRHQGPSIMGFEDEAEQSFGRPCRQKNGRTKRTHELTSSIVPRGTSFHCWVELWSSPVGFNPERFSCCCRGLLPGPPELGAVNPDAVHDYDFFAKRPSNNKQRFDQRGQVG